MDQQGIGTDATIASHIKKIVDRQFVVCVYPLAPTLCSSCIAVLRYVTKRGVHFEPTALGLSLVLGYKKMNVQLHRPFLRAQMEADCTKICNGQLAKADVVQETLAKVRPDTQMCRTA